MTHLLLILTVLSSFLANLEQRTLKSDFTVTVSADASEPLNYPGDLVMHGQCFRVAVYGIEAAYDGKTMYMYSGERDELTLSNPTEQELLEANPFLIAKAMVDICDVTEKPSADGTQTVITLTPKDQSAGINRFTLKVRNEDLMPLWLEVKEPKNTSTLRLTNPMFIAEDPLYVIIPESSTFINDMRF